MPQRLLVPSFHQLVHFAFKSPVIKLHKGDSKAMLEQVCSNPKRKMLVSSAFRLKNDKHRGFELLYEKL